MATAPFTSILLAGGASSRMGRPKALLPFGAATLIERLVARLAPASREVIVVSGPHIALPPLRDARIVLDEEPLHGPLAGICYGLEAAAADVAFVAGCDHPFVGPEVASLLVERAAGGNGAIVVADGVPQPLLAAYRKDVAAVIRQMLASGERRAMALHPLARLVEVAAHELADVDPAGLALLDVDTPEEYAEALEIARRQAVPPSILHTARPPR